MLFTFTQSLQMVGLAPCLFLILSLCALAPRNRQTIIPALYFMALACGFALPLLDVYPLFSDNLWAKGSLLLGESTLSSFSFLLICQFLIGRVPPPVCWLVLAIPLIGGSSLVYASMLETSDACELAEICPDVPSMTVLYHIFSSALIFLLLVVYASRASSLSGEDTLRKHKYWLMVSLIMLHLLVLAVDLARLAHHITDDQAMFASTMFRLTFIYVVMTSLFRVFYPALTGQVVQLVVQRPPYNPAVDEPYAQKIKALLESEHVYRQMRLNRAALASMLGIGEYHLSRIISHHFGKNFNDLINGYRIEEAKHLLITGNMLVTNIGFEVGFNSIASFNRVFHKKVDVSPTEYRASNRLGSAAPAGLS